MKPRRTIQTLAAASLLAILSASAHAEVVAIRDDTAGLTTITSAGGRAKTLAISAKSTAFIRFDTAPTGIQPFQVAAARLTIYFASVTKPGSVRFHNLTTDFTETFPEKSKPAPTFDAAAFATQPAVKGEYLTVDVTAQVLQWLATPATGFGVAIKSDGTTTALIASKEGAGSGHPALLEIEPTPDLIANDLNVTGIVTFKSNATDQPPLIFEFDTGAGASTFCFANTPAGGFAISRNGNPAFSLNSDGTADFSLGISGVTGALDVFGDTAVEITSTIYSGGGPADNAALIVGQRARGTKASPTAVLAGDELANFNARGFVNGGGFSGSRAKVVMSASEDWTGGANGTEISFRTTPNGSAATVERLRITHDGLLKQGSGTGTSQAPNRGIITRRVNSITETNNSIVATDGVAELRRDGTAGGLKLVCVVATALSRRIAAMGMNAAGNNVNVVTTLNCAVVGNSVPIYTDAQNIALTTIAFGNPVDAQDETIVTLHRSVGDNYFIGTVTSTVNQ